MITLTGPTAILHALASSPAQDDCGALLEQHRCWICGYPHARGIPVDRYGGANFTDQDKARCPFSTVVCEPCVWATAWNVPPGFPPPPPGKKGLNLRLFSHLYDDRGYIALNKASKPAILKWLREPKQGQWFAAIADSGQKHVLPWTPLNAADSRGTVRFEERNVALPRDFDWVLIDDLIELLTLGVTKDELSTGRYSMLSGQHSAEQLRVFESAHGRLRGSPWFDLALWLSQRDEEKSDAIKADRAAKRSAAKQAVRGAAGDAKRVPARRSKPAEALGSDAGPPARGRAAKRKREGAADEPRRETEDRGPEQQSLFGDRSARR